MIVLASSTSIWIVSVWVTGTDGPFTIINVGPDVSIDNDPASVSSFIMLPARSVAQVTTSVVDHSVSEEASIVPSQVVVLVRVQTTAL